MDGSLTVIESGTHEVITTAFLALALRHDHDYLIRMDYVVRMVWASVQVAPDGSSPRNRRRWADDWEVAQTYQTLASDLLEEIARPLSLARAWLAVNGYDSDRLKKMSLRRLHRLTEQFWVQAKNHPTALPPEHRITPERRKMLPWDAPLELIEDHLFARYDDTVHNMMAAAWGWAWLQLPPHDSRRKSSEFREAFYLHHSWYVCSQEEVRLAVLWAHARGIDWFSMSLGEVLDQSWTWCVEYRIRHSILAARNNAPFAPSPPKRSL